MATARRIRITCPSDLDILTDAMGKITITVTPRTDAANTDVDPSQELLRGRCNAPTKKPGRPGCLNREGKCEHRAHALWREANGLRIRAITYGVATTRGLYLSYYRAPVLNYYGQHEGEFEQTMQTFKLPA